MTTIAVCLQTCDRLEYTRRTVESFHAHNHTGRFVLLHADDASADPGVLALVHHAGFDTVVRHHRRRGWLVTRTALLSVAARYADWALVLENDIESLRPFPWALFDFVRRRQDIYCLRLYGRFKDQARRQPCLETHKRRCHVPVQWRPLRYAPESAQIAEIHWSAQPAVSRIAPILSLHRHDLEPDAWTVRVKKNVMAHIGIERTAQIAPVEIAC